MVQSDHPRSPHRYHESGSLILPVDFSFWPVQERAAGAESFSTRTHPVPPPSARRAGTRAAAPAVPPGAGGEHGRHGGVGGQPAHHCPGARADDPRTDQDRQGAARHAGQSGQAAQGLRGAAGEGAAAGSGMAVLLGEVGEGDGAAGTSGAEGQVVAPGFDGCGERGADGGEVGDLRTQARSLIALTPVITSPAGTPATVDPYSGTGCKRSVPPTESGDARRSSREAAATGTSWTMEYGGPPTIEWGPTR